MKKFKTLGKITALIVICILGLSMFSCGYDTAMIGHEERPFVVTKVKLVRKEPKMSRYYGKFGNGVADNVFGSWRAAIVLPSGLYSAGDTIKIEIVIPKKHG